ncbi:FecCD family ABC transporter permease [Enterobacter mori]|uniref:FecCD family ABC transporter permease n=1 Tax=Enterobacter mori TaxID=539813 RepID=UPI0022357EFE|nr:iron ABC transporter permease [Enterobacter mori]MCW4990002.1 iron ABC transporter permease [Enterobacter mori]HDR2565724.1 iron ABC transporter permease [Enterobacter ludwigii]
MPEQKTYRQLLALLCVSLVLMSLASLFIGRYSLSVQDVVHILLEAPHAEHSREKAAVIFDLRLPRIIAAVMVGAGLSVAGATYQAVLKNALASPDVLGTSSASAFGAALGIVMGLSYQVSTGCAFIFGMLSLALVFGLCFLRQSQEAIVTILSGLIVASVFVAFVSVLKYLADPEDTLPAIVFWLMGSFSSLVKTEVFSLVPLFMFCYYVIYRLRWTMNILSLGDDEAKIQGLHPLLLKIILLVSASVMISASVVICGVVGWVGLVIPHLVRALVGNNHGKVIPITALCGALFLLVIDTLARALTYAEIPVGILTALTGAPLFAFLYVRGASHDHR